jgi:two-component system sensor histidine kinase YesM
MNLLIEIRGMIMGWSIRKKLIIFLILVTILPFGLSIAITYYHTTKSLIDQFVSKNYDLIVKGKDDITAYLQSVAMMTTGLYRYTPFMNVMSRGVSEDLINNQEEIRRMLIYLYNTRPEIEQLHLYIDNGHDSFTNYHSTLSGRGTYNNVLSQPYYAKLIHSKDLTVIEPPHEIYSYNHLSFIPDSEKTEVLSFHNIIRDIPSDKFLGFFSIDINLSRLKGIAERLYTKNEEDLYIINQNGVMIYSSNEKRIGTKNKEKWFQKVKQQSSLNKSLNWNDDQFSGVIIHEKFSDPGPLKGWYIVERIPYKVLYQSARKTAFINIFIGLVTLVIVVFATMLVSVKLTAPIKILIANMQRVEKGEFQADFESLGNDEFGMLGRHFQLMIAKINELIEKEYKLEIENKSAQLKVLQSQVNPHFLYNAFQSIGTLALKHKAVQVYSLLTSLSRIMRYSMNMNEDVVPLAKEVDHVKSYLALQKQRFSEKFEYELKINAETENIQVPKMILQPLVENCFKHGFDQKEEKSHILIEAHLLESNFVSIKVSDNGIGVNDQQLRRIQEELLGRSTTNETERKTIGLKNIYDRLQIYYHHNAKILVKSTENDGFTVIIILPIAVSKEDE